MISVCRASRAAKLFTLAAAACLLSTPTASAVTLFSSFENDLTTSITADWSPGGNSQSYTTDGATDGTYALKINQGGGWTQIMFIDGGNELATLVDTYDFLSYDVTVPDTAEWRQVFLVMQGDGLGWNQNGGDVPIGTSTVTHDLAAQGYKGGLTSGSSWAQAFMFAQGGDVGSPNEITVTLDNVRFWNAPVPEPASLTLLAMAGLACGLARRRK